jgi:hypothetical protein
MSDADILAQLNRIEDKLDETKITSARVFEYSLGFTTMVAAAGIIHYNIWVGLFLFVAGLVLVSLFSPSRKKR